MNNDLDVRPHTLETNRSIVSDQPVSSSQTTATEEPMTNTFNQNLSKDRFADNTSHNVQGINLRPGNFNSISFHNFHSNNNSK